MKPPISFISPNSVLRSILVAVNCAATLLFTATAPASERRFTYVYEATTQPKGAFEFENWVTWKEGDSGSVFDFRHELEYGVTDRFQLALYLADWRVEDDRAVYRNSALEMVYNLTNPTTDLLGSALYGEIQLGDRKFELEGKVILQKNIGRWVLAYNATIEAEWEGETSWHFDERKGVFEQTAGASYQFSPRFLVGAEILHEIEFEDWSETGDHVVYAGPNASWRTKGFWVTVTPLFQLTGLSSEPDFQTRLIVGIDF